MQRRGTFRAGVLRIHGRLLVVSRVGATDVGCRAGIREVVAILAGTGAVMNALRPGDDPKAELCESDADCGARGSFRRSIQSGSAVRPGVWHRSRCISFPMKTPSFLARPIVSVLLAVGCALPGSPVRAIDANGNGLDDIWELIYGASGLAAGADTDGDGWTNAQESAAGTNPFDPNSRPGLSIAPWSAVQFSLGYTRIAGKRYRIESKTDLGLAAWTPEYTEVAPGVDAVAYLFNKPAATKFWRLVVDDVDTDGDGLMDAEERWLGFDPTTNRTDRNDTTDLARVTAGLNAASVVTLGVLDARMS